MTQQTYRLPPIMLVAALISFSLFVFMAQLINNPVPVIDEPQPTPPFQITFEPKDIPPIQKETLKPQPKPNVQPAVMPNPAPSETTSVDIGQPIVTSPTLTTKLEVFSGAADKQATPVFRIEPQYPIKALSRGIEGYVDLRFDVDSLGQTTNISVIGAEPKRIFNRAAVKALKKWRYQPQMVNGKPVAQSGLQIRLEFNLNN